MIAPTNQIANDEIEITSAIIERIMIINLNILCFLALLYAKILRISATIDASIATIP